MIKVCLTHDVDRIRKTYHYLTKPYGALRTGNVSLFIKRAFSIFRFRNPYWGFDVIIGIEDKYQVKSTFFFLNESVKLDYFHLKKWSLALGRYKFSETRVQDVIRYLDRNGWEVGLHGSFYSYMDYDLLSKEKRELEEILGHPVIGIRQHHLNRNKYTWAYQKCAGFLYDSSYGSNDDWGFVCGHFFPLKEKEFCEIPMIIMDSTFMKDENRWDEFSKVLDIMEEKNEYLVINFHTNEFDELDYPHHKESYIHLIELLQEKNAQFVTMREAYQEILNKKK